MSIKDQIHPNIRNRVEENHGIVYLSNYTEYPTIPFETYNKLGRQIVVAVWDQVCGPVLRQMKEDLDVD